jgi:hypothetical protein
VVANRPVYLAIAIDCDGVKNVLGLWGSWLATDPPRCAARATLFRG